MLSHVLCSRTSVCRAKSRNSGLPQLSNKLFHNLAALNNNHFLSLRLCGLAIWAWLNRVLLLASPGLTHPSAVRCQVGWGLASLGRPQLGWLLSASQGLSSFSGLAQGRSHGSWAGFQGESRSVQDLRRLGSEMAQRHFHYLLLTKATSNSSPDSKSEKIDSTSEREEQQTHIAKEWVFRERGTLWPFKNLPQPRVLQTLWVFRDDINH